MEDKPLELKTKIRAKKEKYKKRFDEYKSNHDIKNCPHFQRVNGNDISLMTEVVWENSRK